MFSNAGKGDIERSSKWIHVYYKMKRNSPEFFANRDVASDGVQDSLKNQINLILPVHDACNILLHKIKSSEPKAYVFDEAIKTFIMMAGEFFSADLGLQWLKHVKQKLALFLTAHAMGRSSSTIWKTSASGIWCNQVSALLRREWISFRRAVHWISFQSTCSTQRF